MKTIPTLAATAVLLLWLQSAQAQQSLPLNNPDYNKAKVFTDLPENIPVNIAALERLFLSEKESVVSKAITEALTINGTIVSKFHATDSSLQSVVIKMASRQGAVFSFSRMRKKDGSFKYQGHIITPNAGDALELVSEKGTWLLRKRSYYDLVSE